MQGQLPQQDRRAELKGNTVFFTRAQDLVRTQPQGDKTGQVLMDKCQLRL